MFARPGGLQVHPPNPAHPSMQPQVRPGGIPPQQLQQQQQLQRAPGPPPATRPLPPNQQAHFLQKAPQYPSSAPQMNDQQFARPGAVSAPQYISGTQQPYTIDQAVSQTLPPAPVGRPYQPPPGPFTQPRPVPSSHQVPYSSQPPPPRQFTPQGQHYVDQPNNLPQGGPAGPQPPRTQLEQGGSRMMDQVVGNANGNLQARNGAAGGPESGPSEDHALRQTRFPGGMSSDALARQQLHSYIYDYLRRVGLHQAAFAFLQDAPDTPVRIHPGQVHPAKGKGRAPNVEGETSSPANGPDGAADSIGSTNSSTSHFGFSTMANNDSPSNSPEFDFKSLPAPHTDVESEVSLLWEWWIVFWDVFNVRSGGGTPNAKVYVEAANRASEMQARRRVPGPELRMQPPATMVNGSPQRINYLVQHNPAFGSPQRPLPPNGATMIARPGQPMPPGSGQPNGRQIQFPDRPPMFVQNGAPPGTMAGQAPPPPQGVARQVSQHRRGALSPAPLTDPVLRQQQQRHQQEQAQLQANSAIQQNHQIHLQQQRHMQEQASQAAALAAQQHHHQQQLQYNPSYNAQVQAAQQAQANAVQANQRAQQAQQAHQQQAMAAMVAQQQQQQRPPSAMAGSPQVHNRLPSNNAGSPFSMPNEAYPPSPAKRFMIPNGDPTAAQHYVAGTPQNYSSPGTQGFSPQGQNPEAFHAYRAQMAAAHNAALNGTVQGSSPLPFPNGPAPPRPPSTSNFSGQSPHPSQYNQTQDFQAYVQDHSRPASAAGNGGNEGSMGPPSGQPPRRTLSQIGAGGSNAPTPQAPTPGDSPSLQPPTPQSSGTSATTSGKRKREVKEAPAPKKRATRGRDRSESVTSTAQAPTPSPLPEGTPVASGLPEYTSSPASMNVSSGAEGQNGTGMMDGLDQAQSMQTSSQLEPNLHITQPPPLAQDLDPFVDLGVGESLHMNDPYQNLFDSSGYDFSNLGQVEPDAGDTSFDFADFLSFPADETTNTGYDAYDNLQV